MKAARYLLALLIGSASAAPNVLNGGTHADSNISPAIVATIGPSVIDSSIFVDYDSLSITGSALLTDSQNVAFANFFSVSSGLNVNHAPYGVVNSSESGYSIALDQALYAQLETNGIAYTQPPVVQLNGQQPSGTAPPTAIFGATSRESVNGGTGWGVEFAIEKTSCASACTSSSFGGTSFVLTADSFLSAEMAGFVAALGFNHVTFNFFDVKGALRQTAANWATGYSFSNYGYGTVSWPNANAVASTASVFLQPPGLKIVSVGSVASLTMYPFRQTRRTKEVIYSCTAGYAWPVKNEYSAADLAGGCGTLLYTSNGTDVTPVYTYTPAFSGTVTFIAFTTDGTNYSRVEPFSPQSVTFVVGGMVCH